MVANRLRKVLGSVVDENQSAFVPGRLITDNILVGYECMHWLKNQKNGKQGFAAAKLDMSKAYDRVEWGFLHAMMMALGFPGRLLNIIMDCITSVQFSFVVNSRTYGSLIPTRGLRQGCPLSPFLFVICAQGLSSILHAYAHKKAFEGLRVAKASPMISHLFFADDSLLFFKAKASGVAAIRSALDIYSVASGQVINYEKSAVSFSPCTQHGDIEEVTNILGIRQTQGHAVYLGLPTLVVKNKRIQFDYLRERVSKKLGSWKNKHFSMGGKEVLIKSIVQAVPTYTMNCFKIPVTVCNDMERACANFWWGESEKGRNLHWARWKAMCKPKSRGGLGFRDLVAFNKALLAKQVWRLLKFPDSLIARVLKGRYFKDGDLFDAKCPPTASYSWRSLLWGGELIRRGTRWRIGNGRQVRARVDAWIPNGGSGVAAKDVGGDDNLLVSELIDQNKNWKLNEIEKFFLPHEQQAILSIDLKKWTEDCRYWIYDEKGRYSIKSGYLLETDFYLPDAHSTSRASEDWWKSIWKLDIPPKTRVFAWRLLGEMLATDLNLKNHHIPVSGICSWCKRDWGSTLHCLIYCESVRADWKKSRWWWWLKGRAFWEVRAITEEFMKEFGVAEFEMFIICLWWSWKHQCNVKHGKAMAGTMDMIEGSDNFLCAYREARSYTAAQLGLLPVEGDRRWIPPRRGVFRLDVDVSIHTGGQLVGVGFIVRDFRGKIKAAVARRIGRTETTLMGELHAILLGIGYCMENDILPLLVYTDSLLAVHVLSEQSGGMDSLCDDLYEAFVGAKERLILEVNHVRREANRAAHFLANVAISFDDVMIWKSDFPTGLTDIVSRDFN